MSVDAGNTELGDTQNTFPQTVETNMNVTGSLQPSNGDFRSPQLQEEAPIEPKENRTSAEISEKNLVENKGEKPADTRYTKTTNKPYLDEIKRRKFDKKAKNKLFVGGLVQDATEDFLYDKFQSYGDILDACIVYEKGTNRSRGFGYVTFSNEKDAEKAIRGADGMRVNGKTLCVEYADDPKFSDTRRPPPPRRRYRSRSPPYYRNDYPPRHRYPDRDRFYDRDNDRDYYSRDRYESDRYYTRDSYDPYYSPRDYYRSPEYRRSPPRRGSSQYNYRFEGNASLSEVDNARLRVDRERVRYEDERRSYGDQRPRSPSGDRAREKSPIYVQKRARSESNSSDEDSSPPKTKPRQVSAFPSAYLP